MPARILVIEDHPANMALMELLLTAYGHAVVGAADGETGVVAAVLEPPDLVVCDVHLPRLDGYGVIAAMKRCSSLQATPVVAVSAHAMAGERSRLVVHGFDGCIGKPIDPQSFVAQIEQHLPPRLRSPAPVRIGDDGAVVAEQAPSVLVVDGSAELLAALASQPLRVAECSAAEAPSRLRQWPVDVVLCAMPAQDAVPLLAALRGDAELAAVPVVLLHSAPLEPVDAESAAAAGVGALLPWPLELVELAARLRRTSAAVVGRGP